MGILGQKSQSNFVHLFGHYIFDAQQLLQVVTWAKYVCSRNTLRVSYEYLGMTAPDGIKKRKWPTHAHMFGMRVLIVPSVVSTTTPHSKGCQNEDVRQDCRT